MHAQAITEFGKPLQRVETPTPEPRGTEVVVKVTNCGVCHSDVHIHDGYFDLGGGAKLPLAAMKLPHTLGHEIEGEVVAIGPDAKGVKIGQRYAVFPWIGCGECPTCLRNEENYCNKPRNLGCSSGVGGGYGSHVLVPHPKYLLDYDKTPAPLAAAYMCSGLTAFGAMKKVGKLGPEDDVLVLGCGGVGMMGVQFAKALFGKGPLAADVDDGRLEAAKKAGAKKTYNTKSPDAIAQLQADTKGGALAVVDFVGSEATFQFGTSVVRRGGKVIIVGLFGGGMAMPIPMFPLRALAIQGSFVGSLPEAEEMMTMVRAGKIDPIPYQTRPLEQASQTLDDLRGGKITGRVVLTP
jgi:D-arabinose 1-dehydrogenase-like Zn-dependent alcohol dehydrogenase